MAAAEKPNGWGKIEEIGGNSGATEIEMKS